MAFVGWNRGSLRSVGRLYRGAVLPDLAAAGQLFPEKAGSAPGNYVQPEHTGENILYFIMPALSPASPIEKFLNINYE